MNPLAADPLLEADALECVKGDRLLFSGLNCSVRAGDILRVSGGNGVGKTTLLRILCGLVPPETGDVLWCGDSVKKEREALFANTVYLGHTAALSDRMTALENLLFTCLAAGDAASRQHCQQALCRVGLADEADLPVRVLSQGQRRRAALARLHLASHRPLWILDEPFTALDAGAVTDLVSVLHQHTRAGGMVVAVTHHEAPFVQAPKILNIEDWAC